MLMICLLNYTYRQHEFHYKMTEEEILQDIISYYPSMAGIPRETRKDQFTKTIGNYYFTLIYM